MAQSTTNPVSYTHLESDAAVRSITFADGSFIRYDNGNIEINAMLQFSPWLLSEPIDSGRSRIGSKDGL